MSLMLNSNKQMFLAKSPRPNEEKSRKWFPCFSSRAVVISSSVITKSTLNGTTQTIIVRTHTHKDTLKNQAYK